MLPVGTDIGIDWDELFVIAEEFWCLQNLY
jgi:hypothetical protein